MKISKLFGSLIMLLYFSNVRSSQISDENFHRILFASPKFQKFQSTSFDLLETWRREQKILAYQESINLLYLELFLLQEVKLRKLILKNRKIEFVGMKVNFDSFKVSSTPGRTHNPYDSVCFLPEQNHGIEE